jgi:CRISPR-associated endonuclease/helicase Cas3
VSEQCAKSGKRAPGIYKLEVPTGGGKTLASMRFALEHAKAHDLDRIVYVIPYLSILDQTAEKFRDIFGVDNMLEHHSNFLPDNPDFYKLHTDRWDVPLILTTQVQFLDSVFSAKGGGLRKLHHMANSVLIFDEVQRLPVKCMHLFNSAVNFLNEVCGSTFLLCTATQPLLDTVPHPIIMSDNPLIAHCGDVPKRTNIVNAVCPKGYSHSELASFVAEKHNGATLVIVNTKAAAKSLFSELKDRGEPVLHLSTNMCGAHREVVLKEIHRRLEVKENIICVSTQLIEAGVDISFECVVRDIAGLDSIYQAAGRCNRHGEFHAMKNVYVVNIAGENLERLADIKIGADITRRLFDEGNLDINEYYRRYFHLRGNTMDFKTRNGGTIYDLLTANTQGRNACRGRGETRKLDMASAIRTAADEFYVIAPGQTDIVAPYGESAELLEQYEKLSKQRGNKSDVAEQRAILRKLGRFSVSVYGFQLDELRKSGALSDCGDILMLATGFYDDDIGLNIDGKHDFLCL